MIEIVVGAVYPLIVVVVYGIAAPEAAVVEGMGVFEATVGNVEVVVGTFVLVVQDNLIAIGGVDQHCRRGEQAACVGGKCLSAGPTLGASHYLEDGLGNRE